MTVRDLVRHRLRDCGVTHLRQAAILEYIGRNLPLDDIAPRLSSVQLDQIDRIACRWLMAHVQTGDEPGDAVRPARDGKMLATGEK
jgi:hypothetical protein